MTCTFRDCDQRAKGRGLCNRHYARWWRLGTTELPECTTARTCAAPDCDRPYYSSGYCVTHYQRVRRMGTTALPPTPSLPERLTYLVVGDCHLFEGNIGLNGYGRLSIGDRLVYAHRVSYEHHVGPIPDGLTIDHLCRERRCINPTHLEPVTRAENTRRELRARKVAP